MKAIQKCLNEWNATIESLGEGKQSILIRKYTSNIKEFLLYPTVTYAFKEGYLNNFKDEYQSFVETNKLPISENKKNQVKYFAKLESIIMKPGKNVYSLSDYHIWTNQHVKDYLKGKDAYVWILRVYKLKKPIIAERTNGIRHANLLKPVELDGMKPVLTDSEFSEIVRGIK